MIKVIINGEETEIKGKMMVTEDEGEVIVEKEMCEELPTFERFWPGREPDFVCVDHAQDTRDIFEVIEKYIRLRPITVRRLIEIGKSPSCACMKGHPQRINVV